MLLSSLKKKEILEKYRKIKNTGSSEVQIIFLTIKINYLQKHFSLHKTDHCGRRGLLNMVSRRRKLLNYIKSKKHQNYISLIQQLGLRY
ncbi:30S ribosomal protein S15 [Buchnera aphidicola (Cinara tujafilina)]|uniref:Small ribosomal subunit protein uS15 n=1 Tax=Buchnera aphidicola (Cinara tujafilina) TaxID=261317 RepID=F7WZG2_9GAMM|nr:30S ribosomal protein S15 [Buchnera aphidicola]AEH39824.1 30S ribosomal protein S15 [Buchnera aphidicola (Cinara tujafilina)]